MSIIRVSDLTFCYEGSYDNIFENVSFQLDTDWRLGLTGRNGRGKTTLLRLLEGRYPYQGTIHASVGFDYFPYAVEDPSLCPMELLERVCPDVAPWRFLRELAPLEVSEDALYRPFSTLSGGEQSKLLLAMLFSRENRFLLIDEPTNHLDQVGRALVSRYLRGKKGFLLVSHDRAFLDGCVDHILSINRSSIEVQKGNFSSWYENKRRQDAFELSQNERLKKEIGRLKEAARQSSDWADRVEGTKIGKNSAKGKGLADAMGGRDFVAEQSRRMQQRRKNLERRQQTAIEEKSALLKDIERSDALKLHPLAHHAQRLAALRDVSIDYGGGAVCSGVSFTVTQGDRVALCGANGCGKSSILKLIPRLYDATVGHVYVDDMNVKQYKLNELRDLIGYIPQKNVLFSGDVASNLRFGDQDSSEEQWRQAAYIACADEFIEQKPDGYHAEIAQGGTNLSGGQRQRMAIARAVVKKPEIYLFDDSFSALDVKTDKTLRMRLRESMGDSTMLIVAQRVGSILDADRILVMEDGQIVGRGKHRELLHTCPLYREIAELQLGEEEVKHELECV